MRSRDIIWSAPKAPAPGYGDEFRSASSGSGSDVKLFGESGSGSGSGKECTGSGGSGSGSELR